MKRDLAYFQLKEEIEEFLYAEADLLDRREFSEWLGLLADDLHYFMPMRRNVPFGQHAARENTRAGEDISWFDEDKWTLSKRVDQIMTGIHWAESRCRASPIRHQHRLWRAENEDEVGSRS